MVTLVGPAGTGKTWLGQAAAETVRDQFADGVYLVDLGHVHDPRLVSSSIAHVLGISNMGNRRLEDTLQDVLRDQEVLLVLDNFEQLLQAAPSVADLVAGCPRLKILVTSRVALRLRGEHEIPVPPLDVPDVRQLPSLDALACTSAVALFTMRDKPCSPAGRSPSRTPRRWPRSATVWTACHWQSSWLRRG